MYRTAVLWVFLAVVAIVAVDLVLRLVLRRQAPDVGERPAGSGLFGWLRVAVNVLGFAALILAASTSLSALLTTTEGQLTGDRLIWHVGSAPAFALAAVAIALFWAHRNRFSAADWSRLTSPGDWAIPLRKLFFWIAVALAIPTLVSILAAMFPLFGTDDQQTLVEIHRYCALPLAAAGLLFAYFALVTWRERSQD
jgi:FtsH-binding integral membrane protein